MTNNQNLTFIIPNKTNKKNVVFGISKEGFFIFLYLLSSISGLIFLLSLFLKGIFFLLITGILVVLCYMLSIVDERTGIENIKYYLYVWKVKKSDKKNIMVGLFEKEVNYITKLK